MGDDQPREKLLQMAYVARPELFDIALRHWLDVMRVGPLYVADIRLQNQVFRGRHSDATCTVALTYLGDIQIELIKPTNDAPSPYTDFMDKAPEIPIAGLYHHFLIDTSTFDATCERLLAGGIQEGLRANLPDGRRMTYLDATATFGCYIELMEPSEAATKVRGQMLRDCRDWDGNQPIRAYRELINRVLKLWALPRAWIKWALLIELTRHLPAGIRAIASWWATELCSRHRL